VPKIKAPYFMALGFYNVLNCCLALTELLSIHYDASAVLNVAYELQRLCQLVSASSENHSCKNLPEIMQRWGGLTLFRVTHQWI